MENFIAYNPTHVHFGKDVVRTMNQFIHPLGKKVLLLYGKGSVLKNGSYDAVREQLDRMKVEVFEYFGIKPNPLAEHVDEAARLGIENSIDYIVAVGGASVIDSAKIVAVAISRKVKAWDIMTRKVMIRDAVPLVAILTLAATGTEMNPVAVLQNPETMEKIGFRHPVMFPRHSFLDPSYTISVPANYTAYGIVDLVAHSLEAFFGEGDASLSDRFVEAIIKEAMEYGPELMADLSNYDLRARIMWAATNALNGLTSYGRVNGDWGVHSLGHILSFLYDTPHGATLSLVYPAWLRKMKERIPERVAKLGYHLFGKKDADAAIEGIERFFKQIGSPVRMYQANIAKEKYAEIIGLMNRNEAQGMAQKLNDSDRSDILNLMYTS